MESIIKVRIIGIDYYTMKKTSFIKKVRCKDINFIDKVCPSIKINNGNYELPETIITAKQQADEWFSNQNELLKSIMHDTKKELNCILNWEVLSIENIGSDNKVSVVLSPVNYKKEIKMSEIEKIGVVFTLLQKNNKNTVFTEDFKNNFIATYQEMKDVLGGISLDKKISIILKAMGVGLKSATNAYGRIIDVMNLFDKKDIELN